MKHGDLARDQLRKAMENKKAQLTVLLSDCCSSYFSLDGEPFITAWPTADPEVLQCLLLQHSGVIDITAASAGEFAWFNDLGGFFTRSLTRFLRTPLSKLDATGDRFVSWEKFYPKLQEGTEQVFANYKKDALRSGTIPKDMKDQATQKPEAFSLEARRSTKSP